MANTSRPGRNPHATYFVAERREPSGMAHKNRRVLRADCAAPLTANLSLGARAAAALTLTICLLGPAHGENKAPSDDQAKQTATNLKAKAEHKTEALRGKVVWLNTALKRRYGISTSEGQEKQLLALETDNGQVLPILEDLRGRSFRTDERLRGSSMELLVRRYTQHPMLQIIRVYEFKNDAKVEIDYWCDVCAIVMFEKGFCACCQDKNRLRKRLVKNGVTADHD